MEGFFVDIDENGGTTGGADGFDDGVAGEGGDENFGRFRSSGDFRDGGGRGFGISRGG